MEEQIEGFKFIFIGGKKFMLGASVVDAIVREREAHQLEHDEMIRLQERLKALEADRDYWKNAYETDV